MKTTLTLAAAILLGLVVAEGVTLQRQQAEEELQGYTDPPYASGGGGFGGMTPTPNSNAYYMWTANPNTGQWKWTDISN